jgi:hypothetical protein
MYKDETHVVFIKYISAVLILVAMIFHVAGITPWNSILQMIAASGWIYVGWKWKEKAILLNFIPQFAIIIPMLIWIYYIKESL